jgi:hypothetical protein
LGFIHLEKTWYYQYRTKGKKYQQRKRLGNYPVVGVVEAIKRAKENQLKYLKVKILKNKSKLIF